MTHRFSVFRFALIISAIACFLFALGKANGCENQPILAQQTTRSSGEILIALDPSSAADHRIWSRGQMGTEHAQVVTSVARRHTTTHHVAQRVWMPSPERRTATLSDTVQRGVTTSDCNGGSTTRERIRVTAQGRAVVGLFFLISNRKGFSA